MTHPLAAGLLLLSPFLLLGIVNRTKAFWAGRKGAPVIQPYRDFARLMRKGEVLSSTTSYVFRITPSINVAAVLVAFLMVPLPGLGSVIHFQGDFILFSYMLALAKFFTLIAAMDTGSSFEGMGASREAAFSTIVETAFFIITGTLALLTGQLSFHDIFQALNPSAAYTAVVKLLLLASLFITMLAEGCRVPVDDPNTHLELTMIHEVMILDYSGPNLAYMHYASGLKMLLFAMLAADLVVPFDTPSAAAAPAYAAIILGLFLCVGIVESLLARLRMSHVPQFLFLITALSLTAFAVGAFFLGGGR